MPIGDPRNKLFHPILTLIMYFNSLIKSQTLEMTLLSFDEVHMVLVHKNSLPVRQPTKKSTFRKSYVQKEAICPPPPPPPPY